MVALVRCDGLLQDLLSHMVLNVSTDKRQLGMEYLPLLKNKLVSPLLDNESEGVAQVHKQYLQLIFVKCLSYLDEQISSIQYTSILELFKQS